MKTSTIIRIAGSAALLIAGVAFARSAGAAGCMQNQSFTGYCSSHGWGIGTDQRSASMGQEVSGWPTSDGFVSSATNPPGIAVYMGKNWAPTFVGCVDVVAYIQGRPLGMVEAVGSGSSADGAYGAANGIWVATEYFCGL